MLLGRDVFWIYDLTFFVASILGAMAIFFAAWLKNISPKYFLVADAVGLATFGVAGTLVSLMTVVRQLWLQVLWV
jgi:uncharacterized membrane protein YeiH